MSVMGHLRDVRVIKDRTFAQFEPMKQTIILLKKHGVILPGDEILVRLEKSKTKLNDVCETALGPVKEKILPLQNAEAQNIKKSQIAFMEKVHEFRSAFLKNCPYHIQTTSSEIIDQAYVTIEEYYN
jgi:hypothetical protein